jgi:acyl carrier protein
VDSTQRTQLQNDIARVIAEITEIAPEKVTPDARFVEDLGADSMNALELLAALEKRYQIVIDPSRLPEMETLGKVTALVSELQQGKS